MSSLNNILAQKTPRRIDFATEEELQDFGSVYEEMGISAKEVLSYIVRKNC